LPPTEVLRVRTATLDIAYRAHGPVGGPVVVLLHGFPDDIGAYARVAPTLAADGCRVLLPWLRGYGPTRFLDPATPRSGEQAALGADLRDFLDALAIDRAILAGYDWGGRAACVVAALWPDRVRGLVTIGGYNIQHIASARAPLPAADEVRLWYQWYFQTVRGRSGLAADRAGMARLLWRLWSPNWAFDEKTFANAAASFDNPDFVDVVIHSYRHRHQNAPGDPALADIEAALARQPAISVPTIALEGAADGVRSPDPADPGRHRFTGPYRRAILPAIGHFLPHEAPDAVVAAVRELGQVPNT
jgi:hypothetical protein